MGDDLVALERRLDAVGQDRGEEPGIEPPRAASAASPSARAARAGRSGAGDPGPSARSAKASRCRRASGRPAGGHGIRGRRSVVGEQDAGLLEQLADRREVRGERHGPARGRRPAPAAASSGETHGSRQRATDPRPPGPPDRPGRRACRGANAIVAGRWVSSASRPAGPGRSRTTVAAGRGSTASELKRTLRT